MQLFVTNPTVRTRGLYLLIFEPKTAKNEKIEIQKSLDI